MNIVLACAMGMSTSLLAKKMKEAAKAQGKDYKIWAIDVDSLDEEEEEIDIVLLGPQCAYREEEAKRYLDNPSIPVVPIDKNDYGRCDGAKVVAFAEEVVRRQKHS